MTSASSEKGPWWRGRAFVPRRDQEDQSRDERGCHGRRVRGGENHRGCSGGRGRSIESRDFDDKMEEVTKLRVDLKSARKAIERSGAQAVKLEQRQCFDR